MFLRRLVLFVLGLLVSQWAATVVRAAPPIQASAQAARPIVQVGEPVRIIIHVKDSEEIPQIDAPKPKDMRISSTGTAEVTPSAMRNARAIPSQRLPSSKLSASLHGLSKQLNDASKAVPNGGDPQVMQQYQEMLKQKLGNLNRSDYSFVYLATPEKIGPATVPPFTVHSNGQTVQTQPIRLNVIEPRPSPWARAALALSNPEPTVGDTVNLYVDLLVRRWTQPAGANKADLKSQPINHVTLTIPSLEAYQEIQPLESLEQFVQKRRLPPGQLGYHINHFPGVILLEQEPTGTSEHLEPHWYRRRLTIPFRALKAGEMEVPPLRVAGEVYVPTGGKDPYTGQGFVTTSSPLRFRIRDAMNRPATPAPQPTSKTREKVFVAQVPPAPADEQSPAERGDENNSALWSRIATFSATALFLVAAASCAMVLHRRLSKRKKRLAQLSCHRQTIDEARRRLRASSSTAADVSAAVQDFLRAHLEMALGEITPEEAAQRLSLAGYPGGLAETCADVLRSCAARQFAPTETTDERCDKDLAIHAERLVNEILANRPNRTSNPPAVADEVTRERQAALAE